MLDMGTLYLLSIHSQEGYSTSLSLRDLCWLACLLLAQLQTHLHSCPARGASAAEVKHTHPTWQVMGGLQWEASADQRSWPWTAGPP